MTKPEITERDASYAEAVAGAEAKQKASAAGGDPAALRSLVQAATIDAVQAVASRRSRTLKGLPLRNDDLLVTLCLGLYTQAFGTDPRRQLAQGDSGLRMEALAALALIFTQAETAWDLLDHAVHDVEGDSRAGWARDFRREALAFAGDFAEVEITLLGNHLIELTRATPEADEDDPGNAATPAAS